MRLSCVLSLTGSLCDSRGGLRRRKRVAAAVFRVPLREASCERTPLEDGPVADGLYLTFSLAVLARQSFPPEGISRTPKSPGDISYLAGLSLFLAANSASTIDGRRKGACLFCQEYFMDLYLLAELKTISLKVTTVDMQKPPPDFRTNFEATPPPILIDNGLAVLENEKIERHIMKNVPGGHNLFVQDKEVETLIENLYSRLKLMLLKKDDVSANALLSHLRKINDHLGKKGTRFLTGDTMCCFDCELMPRLQHIRVAGKYFRDFEIPKDFSHLWRYMLNMYQLDAFTQSCPADQDIINHYKLQQGMKMKKHEELETPTFTTSIPIGVSVEE